MKEQNLSLFGLALPIDSVGTDHRSFRPPSWPPPRDWVLSEDQQGQPLSRWGDETWDFTPWMRKSWKVAIVGKRGRGGSTLDAGNADLMRLLATWLLWGPTPRRTGHSFEAALGILRKVVALASDNGILASQMMRFPAVWRQLPKCFPSSVYSQAITLLHKVWDARELLGFTLVDSQGIRLLMENSPDHDNVQTAFIPPRIWLHQLLRLRLCLDEYLELSEQVEACFSASLAAYAKNFGSLTAAFERDAGRDGKHLLPFQWKPNNAIQARHGAEFLGPFDLTARRFGIRDLLARWLGEPAGGFGIKHLSSYLTLVQIAGLTYVANFTLQRRSELASLRADCLQWEDLPSGRIPIICGETTKTESDSDARWPTSPSVEIAIRALTSIAKMRMGAAIAHPNIRPSQNDQSNPYLFDRSFEPWILGPSYRQRYSVRPHLGHLKSYVDRFPRLFDSRELQVREEDLHMAKMLSPNLRADRGFAIGQNWPLGFHQLRRTGAVNMFASGALSDSSVQFQMKHSSRMMTAYYGRGHASLRFNESVSDELVLAMYETMACNMKESVEARYVSPLGQDRKQNIVVNVIAHRDLKSLAAAGQRGEISFRETRLGACAKVGDCAFGGIESIARCGGGDGTSPCADALFDRAKAPSIHGQLNELRQMLEKTDPGAPRGRAIRAEIKAMENFLDVIGS